MFYIDDVGINVKLSRDSKAKGLENWKEERHLDVTCCMPKRRFPISKKDVKSSNLEL